MNQNQVRTTVYLDENLYLAAKRKALENRTTLKELISDGLKSQLTYKVIIKPQKDIDDLMGIFKTKKKIPFRVARRAFEEAMARGEV